MYEGQVYASVHQPGERRPREMQYAGRRERQRDRERDRKSPIEREETENTHQSNNCVREKREENNRAFV